MGQTSSSRELIALIVAVGWYLVAIEGSHHQFRHRSLPGKVTIPHPRQAIPKGTANSVLKQAGLK